MAVNVRYLAYLGRLVGSHELFIFIVR